MTEPVKRWNIQLSAQGHISITHSDNGRWVEHSDYARLEQERDARIDELEMALKTLLCACISTNGLLKAPTVAAERLARAALAPAQGEGKAT